MDTGLLQGLPDAAHCRVFYETALRGSVSAAARKLGLRPSTVSYHISELERILEAELFDRSHRPARLTAEGQGFFQNLDYIYECLKKAADEVQSRSGRLPELRLGMVESLSQTLAPELVGHFGRETHSVSILTSSADHLMESLKAGRIDFCINSAPRVDTRLLTRVNLYSEPSVLAMPPEVASRFDVWTWERLRLCGLPFIKGGRDTSNSEMTEGLFNTLFMRIPDKIEVNDSGLRMELISRGLGWSLIRPVILSKHRALARRVAVLPMPEPMLERSIHLSTRRGEVFALHGKLVRFCRDYFEKTAKPEALAFAPWLRDYFERHPVE